MKDIIKKKCFIATSIVIFSFIIAIIIQYIILFDITINGVYLNAFLAKLLSLKRLVITVSFSVIPGIYFLVYNLLKGKLSWNPYKINLILIFCSVILISLIFLCFYTNALPLYLSLLSLLAISWYISAICKINPAFSPVIAAILIMVVLFIFGICNILFFGTILIFLISLFMLLFMSLKKNKTLEFFIFSPGVIFFVIASIFTIIILTVKQPFFSVTDEFTHWGLSFKNTFLSKQLPTLYPNQMTAKHYPPGTTLFYFFFTFLTNNYNEPFAYITNTILLLSFITVFYAKFKIEDIKLIILASLVLLLFPYLFSESYAYTLFTDYNLGLYFGAAVFILFYYNKPSLKTSLLYAAILVCLVLSKDFGIIFAAFLMFLYILIVIFSKTNTTELVESKKASIWKTKLFPIIIVVITPLLFKLLWGVHLGLTGVASTPLSAESSSLIIMLKQLITGTNQFYKDVLSALTGTVLPTRTYGMFTYYRGFFLFFLLNFFLYILMRKRHLFKKTLIFSCVTLFLFLAYTIFIYVSIITFFPKLEAINIQSFERYMTSYFIGWLLGIIAILIVYYDGEKPITKTPITSMLCCILVLVFLNVPINRTIWFQNYDITTQRRYEMINDVSKYRPFISDAKVWLISRGDSGYDTWTFMYETSLETETIINPKDMIEPRNDYYVWSPGPKVSDADVYSRDLSLDEFIDRIEKNDIEYLFIYKADSGFISEYSKLFSDNLQSLNDGRTKLYRVVYNDSSIEIVPVIPD